jgi:hypothetical protein
MTDPDKSGRYSGYQIMLTNKKDIARIIRHNQRTRGMKLVYVGRMNDCRGTWDAPTFRICADADLTTEYAK